MCSLEMGEKSYCRQRGPGDQQDTVATGAPEPSSSQGLSERMGLEEMDSHWNSCRGLDTVGRVEAGLVLRIQKTKQVKTQDCY